MSIKAKVDDIEYTLETEADLKAFRAAFKNGKVDDTSSSESYTLYQRIRQFYERVSAHPKQSAVIATLAASEDGLTDYDLRKLLELSGNTALGGIVANISKNARAVNLRPEQVLERKPLKGNFPAKYHYRITPDLRDLVSGSQAPK